MKYKIFFLSAFVLLLAFSNTQNASAEETVTVDIQLQNAFLQDLDLNKLNRSVDANIDIRNDMVSMSGSYAKWGSNFCYPTAGISCEPEQKTIEQWTDGQIMHSYRYGFLVHRVGIPLSEHETFDGIVLNDHEHPIHMKQLGDYLDDDVAFTSIVEELKRRYAAMRAVTPNAKFAWYALVPNGIDDEGWDKTIEAILRATEMGMFEEVDYIVVNLYPRWCPDHPRVRSGWVEKVVDRGMTLAMMVSELENAKGNDLEIYPLLSFKKFGASCDGEPGQTQLDIINTYNKRQLDHLLTNYEVERYGYWEEGEHSAGRPYTIEEAFLSLYDEKDLPDTSLQASKVLETKFDKRRAENRANFSVFKQKYNENANQNLSRN